MTRRRRRTIACLVLLAPLTVTACSSTAAKSAPPPARSTQAVAPSRTLATSAPSTTSTSSLSTTTLVPPSSGPTGTGGPASPGPTSTGLAASSTTAAPPAVAASIAALRPGVWTPIGLIVNGTPTLTATLLQGVPGGPLTGVVRINPVNTHPVLYAGTAEPGGSWPNQRAVGPADQARLVAAFNSGFHTYASSGGWYDHGRTAVPLRAGAASLVIHADGSATVGMWGRDVTLAPDVVSVRQNLGLLVDGGANLSATGSWGATFGHVRFTWRSGLGVDAAGNLVYAAGPGLDGSSLAQVLIQAGAVRAMELDINPAFVGFAYYTAPGVGTDLVPGMAYSPAHWLSGSTRDFIAVFSR